MILAVRLGHGYFSSVAVLIFLQISFWEVLSSQIEEPQKKSGAPLSYHESIIQRGVFGLHFFVLEACLQPVAEWVTLVKQSTTLECLPCLYTRTHGES